MTTTTEISLPGLGALLDIHDWLTVVPDNEWLVNGLIANQSLNMIKAPREVGKTLLVCDWIKSYVMGEPEWLGRKYEEESRGRVVYMVTDANAEAEVSRQLARLGIPPGRVSLARHNGEILGTSDDWVKWATWQQATQGVSVLVVDNGTGMTDSVVDTEATGNLFKKLRAIAGPMGLTVILVHHEKNGGGTAGNYSWESETRWRLTLAAPGGDPWHSAYRELTFKGNAAWPADLPEVVPLNMPRRTHPGSRFTLTERRNAIAEERSEGRREAHQDAFGALMALGRTWSSYGEIGGALGVSASKAERIVKEHGHVRDRASGAVIPAV